MHKSKNKVLDVTPKEMLLCLLKFLDWASGLDFLTFARVLTDKFVSFLAQTDEFSFRC